MRLHDPDEPVYVISVAARLLGVSTHVLRMLDREGILEPARTEKNIRLYSENDLIQIRHICHLMREERINLAGVRAIMRIEMSRRAVRVTERQGSIKPRDKQQSDTSASTKKNEEFMLMRRR